MKQIFILVQDQKDVNKIIKKCTTNGFKIQKNAKQTDDGYYTAKVADNKGNEFTISTTNIDSILYGTITMDGKTK